MPTSAASRSAAADTSVTQQPLYNDFKGVSLGMTAVEVRAKLGTPVLKDDELDYYVFSDILTAQVAYDSSHKAKVISVDYAGGVGAPILFGWIIGTGSRDALFIGYLVAAVLMILGAIVELWIGVAAERRPLEDVAAPLSSR